MDLKSDNEEIKLTLFKIKSLPVNLYSFYYLKTNKHSVTLNLTFI